ncbi:MAG: hypothetical protein NT030_06635 [Candidatus Saganbacteria bacterium]|nr:hypothetical protein [Candidatus Saganbacteria bacterium]
MLFSFRWTNFDTFKSTKYASFSLKNTIYIVRACLPAGRALLSAPEKELKFLRENSHLTGHSPFLFGNQGRAKEKALSSPSLLES